MYYGMVYGAYGDPVYHIKDLSVEVTTSGVRVKIFAAENLGDAYYQVYANNVFAGVIFCPEGDYSESLTLSLPAATEYQITAFRVGSNSSIDLSSFAKIYDTGASTVTASWTWDYEVIGTVDSEYLSAWVVNGLTVSRVSPGSKDTRGTIPVTLTVTGGTAVVNLGVLAQGTGAVGSTITLTALNNSGVSGTVDVLAGAATESHDLVVRWPLTMSILRDETSPPTTEITSISFNGLDTGSYVDTVDVGTYYYAFQATSDTDDLGDASTPQEVTVSGAPLAPEDLEYTSGNYSNTVVSWTASETAGATYNIYVQNPDDPYMDTNTPTQTAIAGAESATIPTVTGYPGIARILVRAVFSGTEELNLNTLSIEYDTSGNVVLARPNVPVISSITVSSGLTIAVTSEYNDSGEEAAGTIMNLYVREPDGSYTFTTPTASGAIGTGLNGEKKSTISTTLSAVGWYYCTVKAESAAGQECAGYAPEIAVYVSDTNISAPTGTFEAARG